MTVEEALIEIRGKAALVRYLASSATTNPEIPDPTVLAGLADVSADMERLAREVTRGLSATALGGSIKHP